MSELNLILSLLSGGIENEHEGTDIHVALSKHLSVVRRNSFITGQRIQMHSCSWWVIPRVCGR